MDWDYYIKNNDDEHGEALCTFSGVMEARVDTITKHDTGLVSEIVEKDRLSLTLLAPRFVMPWLEQNDIPVMYELVPDELDIQLYVPGDEADWVSSGGGLWVLNDVNIASFEEQKFFRDVSDNAFTWFVNSLREYRNLGYVADDILELQPNNLVVEFNAAAELRTWLNLIKAREWLGVKTFRRVIDCVETIIEEEYDDLVDEFKQMNYLD